MPTVFHLMPRNLVGNALQPLNMLRHSHPNVYASHARKYEGREEVMERQVPLLGCLWNDVLFFSNAHPEAIRDGFLAAGRHWRKQGWLAVDTEACGFDATNTVLYQPRMDKAKGDFTLNPGDFTPYAPTGFSTVQQLPSAVLAYYHQAVVDGEPIFAWHGLLHILYRGSLALDGIPVLEI